MKILFVTSSPLNKMHIIDMYVGQISKCFETEIWDVSQIFHNTGTSDFDQILAFSSLEDFQRSVEEEFKKQDLVIITNILIYNLYLIYPIFHSKGIPIVSIDKESMAFWMKDNYERKHLKEISSADRSRIKFKSIPILKHIYSYLEYRHVKFDYILGAYNYFPDACKHFYCIHSLKYDEYLKNKDRNAVIEGKYILFMDAGLAHHPSHLGQKNSVNKEEYLETMNNFFDRMEDKFAMPVIIASHPKSAYKETDFNGRQIILYKTPELLKYADIVLCHFSTSLIEAVLQKKKIIFLYSKDYMDSDSRTLLENTVEYSEMLDATLVDVKKNDNFEIKFNELAYEKFIEKFLVCKDKMAYTNEKLIIDFLKKICDKRRREK